MKHLLLLCLLITASAHAQRAVQKNPNTGALVEGFSSGANTIKLSAAGTLEFVSGFTLTGGSHLKSALSLNNVENTALSTWAGTSNLTTLGTITAGTWNGTAIAIANGGTGSTTAANARAALGLAIGADVMAYTAASTGGNNTADSAKLALYSASGQLTGTGVRSNASGGTSQYGLLGERGIDFTNVLGSGFSQGIIAASPTNHRSHTLPDRSGTLLHADGNGSALTGLSPYQLAQVSASDGQALVWSTANTRWQPGTISGGGLTIGTTTTSGASGGDLLTSDGTNLQKLTPGTGVSTWLATPTLANLNSAVSDADLAQLGANTFTGAQTISGGNGLVGDGATYGNFNITVPASSHRTIQIVADGAGSVILNGTTVQTFCSVRLRTTAGVGVPRNGRFRFASADNDDDGSSGALILSGSGTPESSITAPIGSLYLRQDGGANTTLYVKESGTSNTGWIAK
jgi:hypothetical protein